MPIPSYNRRQWSRAGGLGEGMRSIATLSGDESDARGMALTLSGAVLCLLSGISIGTVIATFSKSAQQALMTSFFVNPPLATLSGAFNPVEAMPQWLQPLAIINPIHHFATIVRAILLKGSGLADLWPNFLGLLAITLVLLSLSVWRFRKQLS